MLRQNFTRKRAILSHVQFYIFQHTPAKINSPPPQKFRISTQMFGGPFEKTFKLANLRMPKSPSRFCIAFGKDKQRACPAKIARLARKKRVEDKIQNGSVFPL